MAILTSGTSTCGSVELSSTRCNNGPAVYPPARQNPQQAYKPDYQFGYPQEKGNTFYEGYGLWSDVISRWESITINRLNSQTWSDNKAKLTFVENLLGESEKLMWQQWRTAYPGAYSALETIADGPASSFSARNCVVDPGATASGPLLTGSSLLATLSKAREDDERHRESRQDRPDQIMLQQVGAIRGTADKLCFVFSYHGKAKINFASKE
nr:hypothetical protein [Tanacetum cinerariifolium]